MPLYVIAIILLSVFLLLIAAPFAIRIGGVVALITFFFGFGVLSIFRVMQLGGSLKQESSSPSPDSQEIVTINASGGSADKRKLSCQRSHSGRGRTIVSTNTPGY